METDPWNLHTACDRMVISQKFVNIGCRHFPRRNGTDHSRRTGHTVTSGKYAGSILHTDPKAQWYGEVIGGVIGASVSASDRQLSIWAVSAKSSCL